MSEMLLYASIPPDPTGNVKKIYSMGTRLFALTTGGTLYARGVDNANGALGNNNVSAIGSWVVLLTNVKDFWGSSNFNLIQTNDNRWFYHGRYGIGTSTSVLVPTEVTSLFTALTNPISKVVVGPMTIAILDNLSNLYTMGFNTQGQLFTGDTVAQTFLHLRTETNIRDIELSQIQNALYIHYNDLSIKGAGYSTDGRLGNLTASNTSLVVVSAASNAVSQMLAYGTIFLMLRPAGWYVLGAATNGQIGNGATSGNISTPTLMLSTDYMPVVNGSYKTWAYRISTSKWYFTGTAPQASGTNTRATVPWQNTTLTAFAEIPTTGFPILGTPVSDITGTQPGMSYLLYNGWIYGCGDATTNKMLPGLGTTSGNLGFRKLNNDFAFVE